ncbi:hypothetical protein L596_002785 [Steinernema carpocapsae]|uniref:Uncharacterized protein n=1 Tax=Steinernema carpocapsae TaxID=34508 RepID=A0A4U8UQ93_STECR|nr:hypothetical protein L596_002785 [Steinernema carpocapsae]
MLHCMTHSQLLKVFGSHRTLPRLVLRKTVTPQTVFSNTPSDVNWDCLNQPRVWYRFWSEKFVLFTSCVAQRTLRGNILYESRNE